MYFKKQELAIWGIKELEHWPAGINLRYDNKEKY